jgi:environmental stress-induced protein Ves
MRVLRAADHKRMPWKNGGGETVEIAVFPDGAGLNDFDWRISMARVEGDGPFSEFPGIDRTLAILDGPGIILDVEGVEPRRLTIESAPHFFPADVQTSARLIDGTVFDFNVMSRRGKLAHDVRAVIGPASTDSDADRLILCASENMAVDLSGNDVQLGRLDALLLEPGEPAHIIGPAGASGFLVTLNTKS